MFILFFLLIFVNISSQDKLVYVKTFIRHGLRSEGQKVPQNKFIPNSGLLQPLGLMQSLILGEQIKKLYIDDLKFIKPQYNRSEIIFRTTQFERTTLSSEGVQMGMFGLGTGPNIKKHILKYYEMPDFQTEFEDVNNVHYINKAEDKELYGEGKKYIPALPYKFQPIPNKMLDPNDDYLMGDLYPAKCYFATTITSTNAKSFEMNDLRNKSQDIIDEFCNYTNISSESVLLSTIASYYENYISTLHVVEDPLIKFGSKLWSDMGYIKLLTTQLIFYKTFFQRQLFFTPLGQEILKDFKDAKHSRNPVKMYIYNVHSLEEMLLMNVFNLTSWSCVMQRRNNTWKDTGYPCINQYPVCSASIVIELWQSDDNPNNYYVMLRYNGDYYRWFDADYKIAYKDFKNRIQSSILSEKDFKYVCNNLPPTPTSSPVNGTYLCNATSGSNGTIVIVPSYNQNYNISIDLSNCTLLASNSTINNTNASNITKASTILAHASDVRHNVIETGFLNNKESLSNVRNIRQNSATAYSSRLDVPLKP